MRMSQLPVKRVFLDSHTASDSGTYEFTMDCGSVYFGAVYDDEGRLTAIDQYFFSEDFSREDMEDAAGRKEILSVDNRDFPAKSYMLSKMMDGQEWVRFHAVIADSIDCDYFNQKYIGG